MFRDQELEFRLERARIIEKALLGKKWSKTLLVQKTGYDPKTIRNLLDGHVVRDQTVIDVCQCLDIEPKLERDTINDACADDEFGGYLRSTHRFYEGFFYLYRHSFSEPGRIFRSVMHIHWDDQRNLLVFSEFYNVGPADSSEIKSHTGNVYMSSYTGLIHFVTVFQGSVRIITATKMRQSDGIMRGSLMTQCEDINFFQPTITPVVLRKNSSLTEQSDMLEKIRIMDDSCSDIPFARSQLKLCEEKVNKNFFNYSNCLTYSV